MNARPINLCTDHPLFHVHVPGHGAISEIFRTRDEALRFFEDALLSKPELSMRVVGGDTPSGQGTCVWAESCGGNVFRYGDKPKSIRSNH